MNATAASETIQAPAGRAPAQWKSYAIFTLCASLYLLPFMPIMFAASDEGTLLCGAERIIHGQVFARDFFEVMGPGTFYWMAAFFKLFGITFLASRICLFISSLGVALSLYFLSSRVIKRYQVLPCVVLAGTSIGPLWPGISHHLDSNFFGLVSVVCLVLWHDRRKNYLLISAGSLAAITTCVLQPKGILLFCAFMAWLWLQRRKTSAPLTAAALLTGGYFAVIALVLAYFWSQGALGSLIYANFVFPSHHYTALNSVPYALGMFTSYWNPWAAPGGPKWRIGVGAIEITPFLFVAALPLIMLLLAIRTKWKSVTPEIALYWLCGWALWLSELHRKDIFHLVFGSALLIVLCVHTLAESRRRVPHLALQMLVICSVFVACLNCCVALTMGVHTSATRVGNVAVSGKETILRLVNKYVSPGEETLIYPSCPTCYFLSATTNPTRYSFLLYNYNTPEQFHQVVNTLDRRRVRYVILDTTTELVPTNQKDLILEPYLESHYRLVEEDHGIRVMERKDDGPAK